MKTNLLHTSLLTLLLIAAPTTQAQEATTEGSTPTQAISPATEIAPEETPADAADPLPALHTAAPAADAKARRKTSRKTAPAVEYSPGGMRIKRRFLPTRHRIDREINKNRFVYKGETMCGLTVSYGTLSTEDADMFPIFENIGLSGNITTVNPFAGYFYRDNNCVGVRFGYTRISGKLDSFGINLGEQNGLTFDVPWLNLTSNRYSIGLFHRSYVPLDEKGRFGAFGEFELAFTMGDNLFAYQSGDHGKQTKSENATLKVGFSPGIAVYAFPNVCATLSFGLGGFKYTHIRQLDEQGNEVGTRRYSKMDFRLNIADIKIGMTVHLWNKKKGNRRT